MRAEPDMRAEGGHRASGGRGRPAREAGGARAAAGPAGHATRSRRGAAGGAGSEDRGSAGPEGGVRLLPWVVIGVIVLALAGVVGFVLWRTSQPPVLDVADSTNTTAPGGAAGAGPSGEAGRAGPTGGSQPGGTDPGGAGGGRSTVKPVDTDRPIPSLPGTDPSGSGTSLPAPLPTPTPTPQSPPATSPGATPTSYSGMAALDAVAALADPMLAVTVTPERTRLRIQRDRLQFKVRATEPGFVYVLMSGTRGDDLYLLFPNASDRDNRLEAGAELALPRKSWEMVFEGPPGKDRFVVLVSPVARDFADLGLRDAGPFQEFLPDSAAARFASRGGQAFVGRVRDCAPGDAACDRFGVGRFEIEETR